MIALLTLSLLGPVVTHTQAPDPFLAEYATSRRFLSGRPVGAQATPDGRTVLFLRSPADSPVQSLHAFDVATGETREILSAASLLDGRTQQLTDAEKAALERMRVSARGFTSFQLSQDGTRVLVSLSGRLYVVTLADGTSVELQTGPSPLFPRFSPDGRQVAYVRDNDVWAVDLAANRERRITRGGTEDAPNGLAEFVAQEEMGRYAGFWWSPDSRFIAFAQADSSALERLAIVDPFRPEKGAYTMAYPRAGKTNATVKLGVAPASGNGQVVWTRWNAEAYPYLATVRWSSKAPLTLVVQDRPQQREAILTVDPATGNTTELFTERDAAWINLDQSFPLWRADGSGFFWFTERNGAPEIELRGADGRIVSSWVPPSAGFESLVGFDPGSDTLWFTGAPDPTRNALFKVTAGGAPVEVASPLQGPGVHVARLAAKAGLLLVTGTSLESMPQTWVVGVDGAVKGELPSVAWTPKLKLNATVQRVGEGEGFWTTVIRPENFEAGRKLPVIVDVYGGPHHLHVRHSMRENLLPQWFANRGFIVVKLEGRGTPLRGRAWERSIRGDFAGPTLEDQVRALHALAEQVPELDLSRVGIQGWSFGGYMSALAVQERPDVFHAAVAGAPVTDWYDYDTHYTERYLGVPADDRDPAYLRSSLLDKTDLRRPLLLIHGTADDNVFFFHTLKLSHALFMAGKPHQVLPLSGLTHMVADPDATQSLYQRMAGFFETSLAAPAEPAEQGGR
ncbi:MAG TPA: DPP IV N-terminal domain-containing protein [Myxococcaceae bacterium]|nr:DPP IV N-terminal domain-containing protein [Myxococcaceae bacterium]